MSDQVIQDERMKTGVPGLDELLGGGLLRNRTLLLKGLPGSGKTTLGMQMIVAGARDYGEPGIILSFEQMPGQLYEDAARFGWDLKTLHEQGKIHALFISPEEMLQPEGRQENRLLVNIADLVDEFGVRRVLIDSISHLEPLFSAKHPHTELIRFLLKLKRIGLTPILTAEMETGGSMAGLDAYLVDAYFHLSHSSGGVGQPLRREINIIKTRGYQHIGGSHPIEIGPEGVKVFPHNYAGETPLAGKALASTGSAAPDSLLGSGVSGLDPLLGGGFNVGSSILVAGMSGTFKTCLAAHYMMAGVKAGEAGLWLSFHEDEERLSRSMANLGLDLSSAFAEGNLHLIQLPPGRETIEKIVTLLLDTIRERDIKRLVIDGLGELVEGLPAEAQQEAVAWVLHRLAVTGVTTLMTRGLSKVSGRNPLTEINSASLVDTIIYLGLVEIESRLEKVVSVLKHRSGAVEGDLRSITCGAGGLRVSDRFVGLSGVLDGTALGHRKERIEQIFQPLFFIRDFLAIASEEGTDAASRKEILGNLSSEATRLIELLSHYFDEPLKQNPGPVAGEKDAKS